MRYIGIDPSTAMLNGLVMKHPNLAGVHPMTYAEAEQWRVLCGTRYDSVLALGGSASYLAPGEIELLRSRAKRDVLLMHYGPEEVHTAPGLEPQQAEASLRAATTTATSHSRVGRCVASILPGNRAGSTQTNGDRVALV